MWCGVVWCGVVWCGVVWCGVVWCGVVGWGVVWWGVERSGSEVLLFVVGVMDAQWCGTLVRGKVERQEGGGGRY